ncbi:hypothetical protein [Aquamicrobium soli]|uniref:Uncharacterized protein n=1 Tax=Aquamicrobium soli TaxID=1811518 RepID=A0ABV7KA35_9HYPH
MNLKFNANALCAVERALKQPFAAIIAELESEAGPALSTLRALLAAGIASAKWGDFVTVAMDEAEAGRLIDQRGVDAVALEVGKALREYFVTVGLARGN